jgi:hypothetical protein
MLTDYVDESQRTRLYHDCFSAFTGIILPFYYNQDTLPKVSFLKIKRGDFLILIFVLQIFFIQN